MKVTIFDLIIAIFSSVVVIGFTFTACMIIFMPILEKSKSVLVDYSIVWSSLAISVVIGREAFWRVAKFLSVEKTQED